MPKLWKRKGKPTDEQSPWFVRIPNYSSRVPPSYTFQLQSPGIRLLRGMGLDDGDEFEMDEFRTLQDLGLTYTLNGGEITPSGAGALPDTVAADISPEQRVRFVEELLATYSLEEIDSDGFYRLLSSIEDGPSHLREQLVEYLLEPTPVQYEQIVGLLDSSFFHSDLLAALGCYAFTEFTSTLDSEIRGYATPIASNDDWVYLLTDPSVWDLEYGLCRYWFDVPDFYLDQCLSEEPLAVWSHAIIEEVHTSQFIRDIRSFSNRIGQVIDGGLNAFTTVIIVPRDAVGDFKLENYFQIETNQ
jgi:hypothetical protein